MRSGLKHYAKSGLSLALVAALGYRRVRHLGRLLCIVGNADVLGENYETNGEGYLLRSILKSHTVSEGDLTIVDVGASTGQFASFALTAAQHEFHLAGMHYHAFEPVRSSFNELSRNTADWAHSYDISLNWAAVGQHSGSVVLRSVSGAPELSSVHELRINRAVASQVIETTVPAVSLDDYFAQEGIKHAAFVRIDTEGADMDVLEGARSSLQDGVIGVLQFEYNRSWIDSRRFLRDAFDLLIPLGYHVGKLRADRVERFGQWDYRLEWFEHANYVAWHPDTAPSFRVDVTERYLTT